MTYLDDLRAREKARKDSRTWAAAAAGQSGLPLQMLPVRQSGTEQPLILSGNPQSPAGVGAVGAAGETVTLVKAGLTAAGTVTGWSRVRGAGFRVELPNPVAQFYGYYDFHVEVQSNEGPIRDLTISASGSETVTTDPTPFCTEWRGVVGHVICRPGDALTIDLGWDGTANVDVILTVGVIEPLAELSVPDKADSELVGVLTDGNTAHGEAQAMTVVIPSDVAAGDVLLLFAAQTPFDNDVKAGNTISAPSALSWNTLESDANPTPRLQSSAWSRVAGVGDAETSVSVTFTPGGDSAGDFTTKRLYMVVMKGPFVSAGSFNATAGASGAASVQDAAPAVAGGDVDVVVAMLLARGLVVVGGTVWTSSGPPLSDFSQTSVTPTEEGKFRHQMATAVPVDASAAVTLSSEMVRSSWRAWRVGLNL